jgi:hypothetical protein
MAVMIWGISYAGNNDNRISPSPIHQGKAIAPVLLNLTGKVPASVYLGSYIVMWTPIVRQPEPFSKV